MNGVERAREQRNWLERLMAKIPGFKSYVNRELRRDVDKLQREHLSGEVREIRDRLRGMARDYTDAGRIPVLQGFDRLDKKLDGLSQAIRFADYGNSGFFDPVKIGEPELERLYEHDCSILDDLEALDTQVGQVPSASLGLDPKPQLDAVRTTVEAIDDKWRRRETVIGDVVETR
jgi:hypothetical protein